MKMEKKFQRVPSPFTAKSVWTATSLMVGSLWATVHGPANNAILAWFQGKMPAVMNFSASYLAGFFIGWGARKTLKITSIVTGILLALVGLFISWGWDGAFVQSWINGGSAWFGEQVEGSGRYLVSLLPSATAAGAGGFMGFRRKT